MVVFEKVDKDHIKDLEKIGFTKLNPKTAYEYARFSHPKVSAILFYSGKLVVQGKEDLVEAVSETIEKKGVGKRVRPEHFRRQVGWYIGSDESLKGDTFGGITVAAVKADETLRAKLIEIGVADSKKLSDKEMLPMAQLIKKTVPCQVKSIFPDEYNRHKGTVTSLLDTLHLECARFLGVGTHVVDKYPGAKVGDVLEEKAESKFVEVAAASILARAAGLAQFEALSMKAGFELPKGSTHVKDAVVRLQEKGLSIGTFAKLHFRNLQQFLAR